MKYFCIVAALALTLAICAVRIHSVSILPVSASDGQRAEGYPFHVILDAGHGGEDGGAIAPDGTPEKDLNLRISSMIASYFELFGVPYTAVRQEDVAVGDLSLPTVRERKTSDIHTRYALVNDTPGAILLSIHQNRFSDPRYSGTQVFYAPDAEGSAVIAESIQRVVVNLLQPDNTRKIKPSGDSIFLLYRAEKPSVLVECGFLSNPEELSDLKDPSYQAALSFAITKGFLRGAVQISALREEKEIKE